MMEQEKRMRREIANSNERRRMESINAGFQTLKTLLPRRDGEKISKASILQQTSDFITQLQREKIQMTQQLNQCKIILEAGGLKPLNEATFQDCPDITPLVNMNDDLPLKKRRKYEAVSTDSSDEGLGGMMSDPETQQTKRQKFPKRVIVPTSDSWCQTVDDAQAPMTAAAVVVNQEKFWESEILQRQLMEIRLALDRERRLRSLLEDQMRNVEINRLQSLSRLSLLEYSPAAAFQAVIHSSPLLATASSYQSLLQMGGNNNKIDSNPSPCCPMPNVDASSPPSVVPKILSPSVHSCASVMPKYCSSQSSTTSTTTLSTSAPGNFADHSMISSGSPLTTYQPNVVVVVPANHPSPVNHFTTGSPTNQSAASAYPNSAQSRQSLEAIVEAIRHLEGDQLFVDDSRNCQSTQTMSMIHQPADVCYSSEHCLPTSYTLFRQEKC